MKVLVAIPCLLRGGTERQTLYLVKILRSLNYEVYVICYFEYETSVVLEFEEECSAVRLMKLNRKLGFFRIILNIKKEIHTILPDIVHVQYIAPGALPIIAARLAGVKTVFATVHQPYTNSHGRMTKRILRTVSIFTSRFISVSQNVEHSWFGSSTLFNEDIGLHNQSHHFTIYNAVDINRINVLLSVSDNKKLMDDLKIPSGTMIIGTVSRLRYEKGIDILIDAFGNLMNEYSKAHLLIVGDGPDRDNLVKKVKEMGIQGSVIFYGNTEWKTAIRLIGIMDIVVVPSRFEGFGLTAAEAMAAGKPIVASDSFGLREVVLNNETGLLFTSEDAKMLLGHLFRLCNDEALRYTFGENGKERCESVFNLGIFRKKIATLYN